MALYLSHFLPIDHLHRPTLAAMCGIFGAHGLENPSLDRARFIACSKKLRHRGPDWSGCFVGKEDVLVHERLAIVGVGKSFQVNLKYLVVISSWFPRYRSPAFGQPGRKENPYRQRRNI